MTDIEVLQRVMSCLDPASPCLRLIRRNGQVLLGLPGQREAAGRALRLYQPQRCVSRWMVKALHGLLRVGQLGCVLPELRLKQERMVGHSILTGIEPGSCGVLLGSPEHRVRRAIASYRNAGAWEVAKISFGKAGACVLEQESRAMEELQPLAIGVPRLLGLHYGDDVTVLRMPYLTGMPIASGVADEAIRLLDSWISDRPAQAIAEFPEWPAIESSLLGCEAGGKALERLSREVLRPVVCHGDFARWNLLRMDDGGLIVLDWEWGHKDGLAGIDLVHYFLQDARLVKRLPPIEALQKVCEDLVMPACRAYLCKTGWSGDPMLPILACLAYKQGAGHQENASVLAAAGITR